MPKIKINDFDWEIHVWLCASFQVCELTCESSGVASLKSVHTFSGGATQRLLSRNRIYSHPSNRERLLVAASDEATSCVSTC